ncbi:hypothetical protein [Aquirufa ecclesiirivi]|uniref:hypothetical protein n=1 Tax=Aquirufa ecclesiirivi TaxID=2715124 RepID=UPI003BB17AAC
MNRFITTILLGIGGIFFSFQVKSQTSNFRFKMVDGSNGKRIDQGIITYEDTLGNFVKFTKIDSSMLYDQVPNTILKLSINAFDYHTYTEVISFPIHEIKYFFLKKDTSYLLSEVIVRPKNYNYLPDTVSMKVKDLRFSTDIKIEDVIKRFPGIKVDENGRITYRNKPIETVLLDGENLMESNYILAIKNIKVDEIDEIEAYDHFSENSIIAELGSSQLTALNLKFARKFSYTQSGKVDIGIVENQLNGYNLQSNSIINTKYVKTFALLSSNNFGDNLSSINYTDYRDENPLYENGPHFPLNYGGVFPNIGKLKSNRNKQFSGNLNNIFKLHSKLTLKSFTSFLSDDFSNKQSNQTSINLPENSFQISDDFNYQTLPKKWGQSVNLKFQPAQNFIIEGKYYLNDGRINYITNQVINADVGFNSQQKSNIKDYYLETLSTLKTGHTSAIQLFFQHLSSKNGLNLFMNYLHPINQTINQYLNQSYLESKFTGKWVKVWIPKKIIAETWFQSLTLDQELNSQGKKSSDFIEYRNTIHQEFKGNIRGWQYSAKVDNVQLNVDNNGLKETRKNWNMEFGLNSRMFKQNFHLNYSKSINPSYRNYYIHDTLFLDSRNKRIDSIQMGIPFLENWNAIISNNQLNKFSYQFSFTKINNQGGFITNNYLSNLFSIQKYQWQSLSTEQEQINGEVACYIKEIAVNFKLVGRHSILNFANFVNNVDLRNNKSISNELTFSAKSGYLKYFNFYEAFTIENSLFENEFSSFRNTVYKNMLQFSLTTPRIFSYLQINSFQFYQGDAFLHFINASFDIKSKKPNLIYTLSMNNLLDIRNRTFVSINDFSRTEYKNYLVGRSIKLGVQFSM